MSRREDDQPGDTKASWSRREMLRGAMALGALGALGGAKAFGEETAAAPPLAKGAVIVFQGDSVTDAGRKKEQLEANQSDGLGKGYPALIAGELLVDHAALGLQIYNRGISGNKVPDLAERWQADAIDLKPDILSVMIGINDLWHTIAFGSKYEGTIEDYERGLRELLQRSLAEIPGVRLVVCEPFTLRDWPAFMPYQKAARAIAQEMQLTFVPFQSVFDDAAKAAPAKFWLWDGIHPTAPAHAIMARAWRQTVGV